MTVIRICFVGDSITTGVGDHAVLGWPGRLCAMEIAKGNDVTYYNLGVRAETSKHVAERWLAECHARLPEEFPGGLVFALGVNDTADDGGGLRVDFDHSLAFARQIFAHAKDWQPTLWIGPAPVDMSRQPLRPGADIVYHFHNDRIAELSNAYAQMASDLNVPYLDLYSKLSGDKRWAKALAAGDGVHPETDGYTAIAKIIDQWHPWRAWFD